MRIEVGMRFSVHWAGHESCYKGRLYEALSISRNCNCSHPEVWLHKMRTDTPIHIHIRAKRIDIGEHEDSFFGFINEDLQDIYDPELYHLKLEWIERPVQLTIF